MTTVLGPDLNAMAAPTSPLERVPANTVNLDQVIEAIVRETGCSRDAAVETVEWVRRYVEAARSSGYAAQRPTEEEMYGRPYEIFDAVVPHGVAARPDTAHDLLQQHLLDPSRDETGLVHDRLPDVPGSVYFCMVAVLIGVISTR